MPQILLVTLFIISLLWSRNISYGIDKIVLYLPFLIFPLYFSIKPDFKFKKVKSAFVISNFTAIVYCFLFTAVIYFYNEDSTIRQFQYSALSAPLSLHPTYFSFYIITAALFIYYSIYKAGVNRKRAVISLALLFLFLVFIILLSSRVAILIGVPLFIYFFYKICNVLFSKTVANTGLVILFVIVLVAVFSAPTTFDRLSEATNVLIGEEDISDARSLSNRKTSWSAAVHIISSHPFLGIGIGDMGDMMNERYLEKNREDLASRSLNTHNQFLQSGLAIGLSAIIILFWLIIKNVKYAFKRKAYYFLIWTLTLTAVMLTESIFETQAGVLFIAFFLAMFIYKLFQEEEIEKAELNSETFTTGT